MDQALSTVTMVPTRLGPLSVQDVGSGPPAVLWHSLFVDSTTWDRVRAPLSALRRLIVIDGPSHGHSPPAKRLFSSDECAGAASDILGHLGIEGPIDWVGNAWGGHVGILFASRAPDRCRSLVTIGTPIHKLSAAEHRRNGALVALYRITGPIGLLVKPVSDALLGTDAEAVDPQAAQMVVEAFRSPDRRGMYLAARSVMLQRQDLTSTVTALATPTLIISGADDALWSPGDAQALAAHMPAASAATAPGAGHVAPILHGATAVVDLVTGFWTQTAPISGTCSAPNQRPPARAHPIRSV